MKEITIFDNIVVFLTNVKVYGPVLVIIIAYFVYTLFRLAIRKIIVFGKTEVDKKRVKTVLKLFENLVMYIIIIIAFLVILEIYGYDTRALITSLGLLGAVLGLGFQDTIKDFINGIGLIMDNYFIVGDTVTYNDFTGEVISIGLRSTKLRNYEGKVYTIANRNITEVINLSIGEATVSVDVPVLNNYKIEKLESVVNDIVNDIKKLPSVINSSYLGVSELDKETIKFLINTNCKQDDKWQVKRDVLKIVKINFDKNKILLPYTKVEVINGKKV